MTRSSPAWLPIAFLIALVGVGFHYWQAPPAQAALPGAIQIAGLAAVAVVAMLARAFGVAVFWKVWLVVAASVPAAVLLRVLLDASRASVSGAWPRDLLMAAALGLGCALLGTAVGSLLLTRSSRRPR
jgi:hypothetical protein